jgi:hypothetical protein
MFNLFTTACYYGTKTIPALKVAKSMINSGDILNSISKAPNVTDVYKLATTAAAGAIQSKSVIKGLSSEGIKSIVTQPMKKIYNNSAETFESAKGLANDHSIKSVAKFSAAAVNLATGNKLTTVYKAATDVKDAISDAVEHGPSMENAAKGASGVYSAGVASVSTWCGLGYATVALGGFGLYTLEKAGESAMHYSSEYISNADEYFANSLGGVTHFDDSSDI